MFDEITCNATGYGHNAQFFFHESSSRTRQARLLPCASVDAVPPLTSSSSHAAVDASFSIVPPVAVPPRVVPPVAALSQRGGASRCRAIPVHARSGPATPDAHCSLLRRPLPRNVAPSHTVAGRTPSFYSFSLPPKDIHDFLLVNPSISIES